MRVQKRFPGAYINAGNLLTIVASSANIQVASQNILAAAVLHEIRLQEAKRLLSETNLSIADITQKIGIETSNYFYSMFKSSLG